MTELTEADWWACAEPRPLLRHVSFDAPLRRLWLAACAGCRAAWPALDLGSRRAVELVEDHADRPCADRAMIRKLADLRPREGPVYRLLVRWPSWAADRPDTSFSPSEKIGVTVTAIQVCEAAAKLAAPADRGPTVAEWVRDVFGNPFRPVVAEPAWLAWNDGTVPRLAEAIYEDRRFEDLPVLADALTDAGCTDPDLLGHLRGPGPHARGCWALDLLLGKE